MLIELIIFGVVFAVILSTCTVIGSLVMINIITSEKYMQEYIKRISIVTNEFEDF